MTNHYKELAAIDVSKWVEKKGPHKLDYLSWPIAVDFLMQADPTATWEFHAPVAFAETLMVSCTVTAFGKPMTMHLPVMDHTNKAVKNPDAFIVNKNMMRCLVKAIACHGLGIKVFAGEDLPSESDGQHEQKPVMSKQGVADNLAAIDSAADMESAKKAFAAAYRLAQAAGDQDAMEAFKTIYENKKQELGAA
jgi:hypothetical protein